MEEAEEILTLCALWKKETERELDSLQKTMAVPNESSTLTREIG